MTTKPTAGRVQDAELTERILDAAEDVLRVSGFSGLRVGAIATTVGCGKTAIYRRWADMEGLAADIILRYSPLGDEPDTGDFVEDLVLHQEQSMIHHRADGDRPGTRPLWAVLTEPGVRSAVAQHLTVYRRDRGRTIVARGIGRGELPPETDADALLDMVAGFAFYRTIVRDEQLTPETFRQIASSVAQAPPLRVTA
ncbi:TetR/AcrR family transcriptional regulator [Mycetocola spongiae]|uniref:TetR/AcrR family transcriptional regulator n=1 Tax=Mycetocola spongiae TaxID=2859226 RepID=UPI001CF1E43A|nr:TetR/AcrR family transcriptional regulator [Mycetocola spongiae]UCR90130.1 TetR/AcrR family transcriptional regulator [Mycetocola spongiae]